MPTSSITSSSHTRHLRNRILTQVTGANRCNQIPDFPNRLGITAFQERSVNQHGNVTYHTHLHLYNCFHLGAAINADPKPLWKTAHDLHFLIRYKVGSKIEKLLKSSAKGNEGVVVRKWEEEHHRYYNLKEMDRQRRVVLTRYTQDGDLLLDYANSDLLPMQSKSNGYQRLSQATY